MGYLRANQGDAEYLVAAIRSRIASPIILNTDEPVISLGGFHGRDPVFRSQELVGLVDEGTLRFFLMKDDEHKKKKTVRWIQDNCERVPQELWHPSSFEQALLLYDCGTGAR
jgi:4-amino-4-deoxy-L-arabinose transferase-like glycosyltransferase